MWQVLEADAGGGGRNANVTELTLLVWQVLEVEEEMRTLQNENEASKRDMEDKFKRLTRAMTEIQQGLF